MIIGEHLTFAFLSNECQLALMEYLQCETIAETNDRLKDRTFCFELVPVDEAKQRCMQLSEDLWGCTSFGDYHELYVACGDIPDHGESKWPCIAPGVNEWLDDGWHRFHSYIAAGDPFIPLLTFK